MLTHTHTIHTLIELVSLLVVLSLTMEYHWSTKYTQYDLPAPLLTSLHSIYLRTIIARLFHPQTVNGSGR